MTIFSNTSRLATYGAETISNAYSEYRTRFDQITARAEARFPQQDWKGMRSDRTERLYLYKQTVDQLEIAIRDNLQFQSEDKALWANIKDIYAGLIDHRHDRELAETIFNSVTRRIFITIGVDSQVEFWPNAQQAVNSGQLADIVPYPSIRRLKR